MSQGKGSRDRTADRAAYAANWERIFGAQPLAANGYTFSLEVDFPPPVFCRDVDEMADRMAEAAERFLNPPRVPAPPTP